jgi:2-amino-4-hydroxy-6-hydroxymethyldihydropteridine diphosphokinase
MIFIGLGANLPTALYGPPRESLAAAIECLNANDIIVGARSGWYRSAPVPASDQPWFVNAVVAVGTKLEPVALLDRLHLIEAEFGRVRGVANAARVLDLDLIDYDGRVLDGPSPPILPHPRLRERAFVLLPLAEIAPGWTDPRGGTSIARLLAGLDPGQSCIRDPDDPE